MRSARPRVSLVAFRAAREGVQRSADHVPAGLGLPALRVAGHRGPVGPPRFSDHDRETVQGVLDSGRGAGHDSSPPTTGPRTSTSRARRHDRRNPPGGGPRAAGVRRRWVPRRADGCGDGRSGCLGPCSALRCRGSTRLTRGRPGRAVDDGRGEPAGRTAPPSRCRCSVRRDDRGPVLRDDGALGVPAGSAWLTSRPGPSRSRTGPTGCSGADVDLGGDHGSSENIVHLVLARSRGAGRDPRNLVAGAQVPRRPRQHRWRARRCRPRRDHPQDGLRGTVNTARSSATAPACPAVGPAPSATSSGPRTGGCRSCSR